MTQKEMNTGPGIFGPRTEAALKEFQKKHGVPATGYYGPKTRAALREAGRQGGRRQRRPGSTGTRGWPADPARSRAACRLRS